MVTELFTAVALPRSHAADAEAHVSVLVAPQLTPDGDEGTLADFTHFPRWAHLLADGATVTLADQTGPIEVRALLTPIEPDLFDAVLPPDTPVRAPGTLDWSDRHWRTFPAAELHDAATALHTLAVFSGPTTPPAPSAHPLTRVLDRLGVRIGSQREPYDESRFTARHDRLLEEWPSAETIAIGEIESIVDGLDDPIVRLALQLHRARRFYERPEAQREYRERPDPDAVRDPLPRPEPDVHERCTLVGDHPGLQRRLGLVLDLEVRDPTRLAASQWLAARIVPSGDEAACRSPRTRVATAGDDLVTVPRTDDWDAGRLRLGDVERFAVLDVDPDGAALKLERFLWTLPRLAAIERNGDPVHAAPAALRSLGFTVVQRRRATEVSSQMAWQRQLATSSAHDRPVHLATEDVTQGLRVEVWDDEVGAWYSLHARRIDVEVTGLGTVATDVAEEGFVQGATATETPGVERAPVHVHEAVFGWDGWSLAAPRPGARVRHEDGDEVVEDPDTDPDPVTPLTIHTRVEPGTLPRLRFGRSYAFRAWAVDLAGNSRPHPLGPPPAPSSAVVSAVTNAAGDLPAVAAAPSTLVPLLRSTAAAVHLERDLGAREARRSVPADEALRLLGAVDLDRPVLSRLRARRGEGDSSQAARGRGADRASLVARRFADVLTDEDQPLVARTATVDPAVLARALGPALPPGEAPSTVRTVTPLRPFLRWHPVEPPALVPRRAYSAGESLRHLVIRSGVQQDPVTLEITVTPPEVYAADLADLHLHPTSERHVAPPKTSQSDGELHGEFDDAIGSSDPADHARLLAVALRESGTFFDVTVPRLDDPSRTDEQPGIELAHDPGVPASELATRTLPLPRGDAPVPGQYVVHDVERLRLPYLPDVLARGISLVFPDAGQDRDIAFPFGTEGFTARYRGDWPERQPIRLVLAGSDELDGHLEEDVLTLSLPAGDVQRFRLASAMDRDDLRVLGPWRALPAAIRDDDAVAEAAADGWLWALTPFDEVTLVHAVPRPLEAPRPTRLVAHRAAEGSDEVVLIGAVDVHGPSTEQLTAEAVWTDPVDDLTLPTHELRTSTAVAFTTPIRDEEDLAVLALVVEDQRVELPGEGPVWIHRAVHHLGDTRHHRVRYRFRAATRFREYFDAPALAPVEPAHDGVLDDGQSVVGPEVTLSVPSSARPAPPIVHSVVPLFRWDEGGEPEQPVARRHRRRAGVRIYLERPWFSSGEGELLGVLLAPGGDDAGLGHLVSQWGTDPVWLGAPIAHRAMSVELDRLLRAGGLDDRPGSARPVVPPATLPLSASPGWPPVTVLGYRPRYNLERGLWYVDVAVDAGDRFWPFVRLSVARYQPASLHGCHLSAAVRCDLVQLTPERTTSVSRTDLRHVRVVVSGPVGLHTTPPGDGPWFPTRVEQLAPAVTANRKVVARLQRRDPAIPTDLGWETVTATELVVRGHGRTTFEAAWVGSLEADQDLPLRRPKDDPDWRVTVEEWERLPGDPADLATPRAARVWEQRLVYADEVQL